MNILFSFVGSALVVLLLYFFYWLSSYRCSRNRAYAECWWLPGWNCYRFVIRNRYSKDNLLSIKYRAWLRVIQPAKEGCSVRTLMDTELVSDERTLLPAGQDLTVLCFRFEKLGYTLKFIQTDKFGKPTKVMDMMMDISHKRNIESINVEYYLKLKSWFLFKHEIARAFVIPHILTREEEHNGSIVDVDKDIFTHLFIKQQEGEQRIQLVFQTSEITTVAV